MIINNDGSIKIIDTFDTYQGVQLTPPLNFAMVDGGIFRLGLPAWPASGSCAPSTTAPSCKLPVTDRTFSSVLNGGDAVSVARFRYLCPENTRFLGHSGIKLHQFGIQGHKVILSNKRLGNL